MRSISASICAISCSAWGESVVLLSSAPGASAPMVTATMAAAIDKIARCVLRANGSANRMGGPLCWNQRFGLRFATSPATGGSCHIRKKDAKATKQQYGARRQLKIRHEGCKNARQHDDRKDHQRKRAVIDKQPDQFAEGRDQHAHDK